MNLIEVSTSKNGQEIAFRDDFLEGADSSFVNAVLKDKDIDTITVWLSNDNDELLDIRELSVTPENCYDLLLSTLTVMYKERS